MSDWKSSVLNIHAADDECPICLFLDGRRDTDTLMKVIELLDAKLADREKHFDRLIEALIVSKHKADGA